MTIGLSNYNCEPGSPEMDGVLLPLGIIVLAKR